MFLRKRFGVAFLLMLLCLLFVQTPGQSRVNSSGTGGIHSIRGRIYLPNGKTLEIPISVELESTNFGKISVTTDHTGGFLFQSLTPGNYTVVINAGESFEVAREYITIDTEIQGAVRVAATPKIVNIPVYLELKRGERLKNAVINSRLATVPKAAVELYEAAQRSISEKTELKAVTQLRDAIAIHKPFSLAWNDLGVLLQKLGDPKAAIDAFRSAVQYDPESAAANLNLGCALYNAKAYQEAERHLTTAIVRNGSSYRGHYYMGLTQLKLGRPDIAEQAFRKAIEVGDEQAGMAHYMLGGIYWSVKRYKDAADELEQYLKLEPNAKDTVKTRESIAELRRKQN